MEWAPILSGHWFIDLLQVKHLPYWIGLQVAELSQVRADGGGQRRRRRHREEGQQKTEEEEEDSRHTRHNDVAVEELVQ